MCVCFFFGLCFMSTVYAFCKLENENTKYRRCRSFGLNYYYSMTWNRMAMELNICWQLGRSEARNRRNLCLKKESVCFFLLFKQTRKQREKEREREKTGTIKRNSHPIIVSVSRFSDTIGIGTLHVHSRILCLCTTLLRTTESKALKCHNGFTTNRHIM